nr:hypothetical protein [Tanacetum cinerariifolium]
MPVGIVVVIHKLVDSSCPSRFLTLVLVFLVGIMIELVFYVLRSTFQIASFVKSNGEARVAFEDEFGAAEDKEVSCEAQQGQSEMKRKLFGSCRNNMGNEPILALPKGSDNFVMMRGARVETSKAKNVSTEMLLGLNQQMEKRDGGGLYFLDRIWTLMVGDVRTLIIKETHVTKYFVRPRTDGQSEHTIWTLNDMLRACERDLVVVGMLIFCKMSFTTIIVTNRVCDVFRLEALYGRKCRSPMLWSLIRLELVLETTDKVVLIKEKLKAERDRQKSYADKRRKPLEFEVGDRVLLKVSPWVHFDYRLRLRFPEELSSVHDTFHVKKCLADAILHVPLDEIKVDKTLRFIKEPVEIMDLEIRS